MAWGDDKQRETMHGRLYSLRQQLRAMGEPEDMMLRLATQAVDQAALELMCLLKYGVPAVIAPHVRDTPAGGRD